MCQLKFFEYSLQSWRVFNEAEEQLGELRKRYGNWCFHPYVKDGLAVFLTEDEVLAIMVKLSTLNKNNKVIVISD